MTDPLEVEKDCAGDTLRVRAAGAEAPEPDKQSRPAGGIPIAARRRLWCWAIGRHLIHLGLHVMPDGPAKRELVGVIQAWGDKVRLTVAIERELRAALAQGTSGSA